MDHSILEKLFFELFDADTEDAVTKVVKNYEVLEDSENWHPLGDNRSNFGIIENQQSTIINHQSE